MQKYAVKLTCATLLAGLVAAALRLWELKTVFDPDTGLAEPNALQSLLLIALCVLFAVVLLLGCLRLKGAKADDGYQYALHSRGPVVLIISILLLAMMLAAAFLCYKSGVETGSPLIMGILALFAAAAAVSYLDLSYNAMRKRGGGELCLACVLITIFLCYWLIIAYKNRAADPVLLDYVYDFLALCAGALASYYVAGYAFGRGSVAKTVYFAHLASLFCIVAIVGQSEVYSMLFYAFLLVQLQVSSFVLLCNSRPAPQTSPEGFRQAEEKGE